MFKNKKLVGLLLCASLLFCSILALTAISPNKTNSKDHNIVNIEEQKKEKKNTSNKQDQETKIDEPPSDQNISQDKKDSPDTSEKSNQKGDQSKKQITPKENQPAINIPDQTQEQYVTIAIDCRTILNNMDQLPEAYLSAVPSNGTILSTQKVKIQEGDTVFDVILKVTKQKRIPLAQSNGYIQSINALPEKIFKGSGGWMYSVNGNYAEVGCKDYKLKNNDKIEWRYTCFIGDIY